MKPIACLDYRVGKIDEQRIVFKMKRLTMGGGTPDGPHIWVGRLDKWKRVCVLASKPSVKNALQARLFILEADPNVHNALRFEGFYVLGNFRLSWINNPRRAREGYNLFIPE
jgi:hypothetical protein